MKRSEPLRVNIFGAELTRRGFVKAGGALFVGFSLSTPFAINQASAKGASNSLDATLPGSWIEIHPDNTIVIRTGKPDFGQGSAFTAYRQIVAEELNVEFEAITKVVTGDTDRTPDGSGAFDFLGRGTPNIRKAAAYTYQALLNLAAHRLGVAKSDISATDGRVSGGGKSMSYGELVAGQQLKLTIPVTGNLTALMGLTVTGNPPMKPVDQYRVIGKSYSNSSTVTKVAATAQWVTDVRLRGMLHGRMVHPKSLGASLISAGKLDKLAFPNSQLVVLGNLVGIVAPTEWEAIGAAQQVARNTQWTNWKGLPGNANLFTYLRNDADWKATLITTNSSSSGKMASGNVAAENSIFASYELPFLKHAPIGPAIATADVRVDGTVFVYTNSQNPQVLRGDLAHMLDSSIDKVVVRALPGPGHYGRSNGGNAGAEDEAVILSKAVGKPVRVQWMRREDFQWSTQSPAGFSDVAITLDGKGRMASYRVDHYMPAMQDDRLIGAVLAGLPTVPPPSVNPPPGILHSTSNRLSDPWIYDKVPTLMEHGHGAVQIGQEASPLAIGMRDHSLRTPTQYQQNFPRELAISEAAALAGIDALQFRIDHATDDRLIGVLETVREASSWETRSSPQAQRASRGPKPVTGRGVSALFRAGTYWACVCEITVVPESGAIKVDRYTIAVDPGIVVNPMQLKRQVEGGAVMGISMALLEEVIFDESGVTSSDWGSYPILTMADVPEIKVVLINRPEVGAYGGGSEAANALAAPAIAAALYDATGKILRRLPLRPEYVRAALNTAPS